MVLQVCGLVVASVAYSLAFGANFLRCLVFAVFLHYVVVGAVLGVVLRMVCEKYLRVYSGAYSRGYSVKQDVEWLYCWDVHCNAFVPVFLLVYLRSRDRG